MGARLNVCDHDRLQLLAEDRLSAVEIDELESHLQGCVGCLETLDGLVGGERWLSAVRQYLKVEPTEAEEPISVSEASLDFLAPTDWPDSLGRLGSYEVKGLLGRGGMGVVLKALDPALNRYVAIKVLSAHLANCGAARRRFLREARAAAAVVHEHVVSVFAVIEGPGLPFLVMEYVPGRSLQERLDRQGPLSLPEILRIGMQTASGLAAAHAQGLVHRDVKPANILLENGVERVRLSDFGLARAAADAALTQSGVVTGTPHYMAPEQARAEATDSRADLFSLGSTLYAACVGHPPFRAESPLAVLRRVCDDEARPLRVMNPDLPAWLEVIIGRLMSKAPEERYQTASEVAGLLSRCLAHVQEPLVAELPPELNLPLMMARGQWRGRALRWAGAITLGLGIIAGGATAYRWGLWPTMGKPEMPRMENDPGTATVLPASSRAVSRSDELDHPLREAWRRAEAIENDLRRVDRSGSDSVSALARSVSEQAANLAREMASQGQRVP